MLSTSRSSTFSGRKARQHIKYGAWLPGSLRQHCSCSISLSPLVLLLVWLLAIPAHSAGLVMCVCVSLFTGTLSGVVCSLSLLLLSYYMSCRRSKSNIFSSLSVHDIIVPCSCFEPLTYRTKLGSRQSSRFFSVLYGKETTATNQYDERLPPPTPSFLSTRTHHTASPLVTQPTSRQPGIDQFSDRRSVVAHSKTSQAKKPVDALSTLPLPSAGSSSH